MVCIALLYNSRNEYTTNKHTTSGGDRSMSSMKTHFLSRTACTNDTSNMASVKCMTIGIADCSEVIPPEVRCQQ